MRDVILSTPGHRCQSKAAAIILFGVARAISFSQLFHNYDRSTISVRNSLFAKETLYVTSSLFVFQGFVRLGFEEQLLRPVYGPSSSGECIPRRSLLLEKSHIIRKVADRSIKPVFHSQD